MGGETMENLKSAIKQWRRAEFVIVFSGKVNDFAAVIEVAHIKPEEFDGDGYRINAHSIAMLTRKLNINDLLTLAEELPGSSDELYVKGGDFIA